MSLSKAGPTLSLVVPMRNEEEGLAVFFDRVRGVLRKMEVDWEIVCVNDGSTDATWDRLQEFREADERIRLIDLSRNFGKENALSAGLDYVNGDAVVPLDADLQDPPELIPEMLDKWLEGYDVVLAVRSDRSSDSPAKRWTSRAFYRVFSLVSSVNMTENAGDFRLMDRRVVQALRQMPERNRFMKGMFAWLGFRQAKVYFTRPVRAQGDSKWSFWRLWNLALDGVFSFSTVPLRIWSYIGVTLSFFAMIYLLQVVVKTLLYGADLPGYPSMIAVILFFNGVILLGFGIMGEYLARIFIEVKQRPVYLVRSTEGFEGAGESE